MPNKGIISVPFFHPKFKAMWVNLDYEVNVIENGVELSNPTVTIPSLGVKSGEPRDHPEWRTVLKDQLFRGEVERQLLIGIGPSFALMEINFREIL